MKIFRYLLTLLLFMVSTIQSVHAQNPANDKVEMADLLHQNGKIYLVVLVLLTIFAGIIFMLVRIELKLNKLEKEQKR